MNNTLILWEEKNLIEPSTKLENKQIFVPSYGINEINNVSAKPECNDTGNKNKWSTKCPDCGEEIPIMATGGDECKNCGHIFWPEH